MIASARMTQEQFDLWRTREKIRSAIMVANYAHNFRRFVACQTRDVVSRRRVIGRFG